jgi:uncharacterized protein with FMN-binding domain
MMKYSNFLTKILCFILVFAALVPYQARASKKAEAEAENAAQIAEVEAANREVRRQMADAENASPYADGVYEGTAEGFGGPISVEVTIDGGDITGIRLLDVSGEDPAYLTQVESLLDQIMLTQGVNVDTISGATFTSKGLIHAVTEALRKALT